MTIKIRVFGIGITGDVILLNMLSALFIAIIAFFQDSPVRVILGLPFILFFPGYILICALFPRKGDLDSLEKLALCFGINIAVTTLIGLALDYTPFGLTLRSTILSLFFFILIVSILVIYRRKTLPESDTSAPLSQSSVFGYSERIKGEIMKFNDENRIIKAVALIAFVFITLALVILKNSPAKGYEASIYASTPFLAWIFLIGGLSCGYGITVYNVYRRNENRNKLWVLGFLLVLLSSIAITSLHHIRSYFLYGSMDVATHIGYIQHILSSGHAGTKNIYPMTHIYLAQLSQVLNIEPVILLGFIPAIFYILYAAFMYLFARTVLPSRGSAILATLAGLAIMRGCTVLYPCGLTTLVIPMALYLFCKSNTPSKAKVPFTALFVIILILFPVSHPIPAIVLILLLLTIWVPGKVIATWGKSLSPPRERSYKFNSIAFLLLIVWFITWISSFFVWESAIRNLEILLTEGAETNVDALQLKIEYAQMYGYSVWEQFFKQLGGVLVWTVLTLAAFPVLIKRMRRDIKLNYLFAFYAPLIACALAVLFGYFSNTTGLTRITGMVIIICSLFVGFLLYEGLGHKFSRNCWRNACISGITALLIIVTINGMLVTYASPYTLHPNDQVTFADFKGMDWFFHSKNVTIPFLSVTINPLRYADMILAKEERSGHGDIRNIISLPPFHFDYHNNNSLGFSYEEDRYMVLKKEDRVLYTEVWPDMAKYRFLPRDFEQLENDDSVDKLYSNGGLDAYFIHARRVP